MISLLCSLLPFASPSPAPRTLSSPPASAWTIRRSISKKDDSVTVTLVVGARASIRAWPGKVATPRLILRCQEGDVEAYVNLGAHPAIESEADEATVDLRFDKEPAFGITAGVSTDGEAVFLKNPQAFILEAVRRRSLWLRFTPFNSPPQETSFPLAGLATAVKPLQKACDWNPQADAAKEDAERAEQKRLEAETISERTSRLLDASLPEQRRLTAAYDLGHTGSPDVARTIVPALIKALNEDPSATVRAVCARSLADIGKKNLGPTFEEAIAALEVASRMEDAQLARAARIALARLKEDE
jgi:type VI secretion system protein VasI